MRGNVQALFGGEGLVFLGNQDPASYPTLLVKIARTGRYTLIVSSGSFFVASW